MEHKLRSHELEATLSSCAGPIRAFAGGRSDLMPQQDKNPSGVVGSDVLSSMAALKQRQQLYMEAVGSE